MKIVMEGDLSWWTHKNKYKSKLFWMFSHGSWVKRPYYIVQLAIQKINAMFEVLEWPIHPGLPRTFLVWTLEVPCYGNLLSPRLIGTVCYHWNDRISYYALPVLNNYKQKIFSKLRKNSFSTTEVESSKMCHSWWW